MYAEKSALPNLLISKLFVRRRRPRATPYKKLAIVKVDRLGDFILALGVIRTLIQSYGATNVVLVVSAISQDLAAKEFPEVERVVVRWGNNRLWESFMSIWRLRRHPIFRTGVSELACLRYHRKLEDELIVSLIPASHIVGASDVRTSRATRPILEFDRSIVPCMGDAKVCAEIANHQALAKLLLNRPITTEMVMPLIAHIVDSNPTRPRFIGVSPFGSRSIRDIPLAHMRTVVETAAKYKLPVVLWSPPNELVRYAELAKILSEDTAVDCTAVEIASVSELISEIAKAVCTISSETVTAHIATALNRPLVAFLGGGHFNQFAPWVRSCQQHWLHAKMSCYNCDWQCPFSSPRCLHEIDVMSVRKALTEILSERCSPSMYEGLT